MVEGFEYKSYPKDLVQRILNKYLADTSLENIALQIDGISSASAQRIVNYAISTGVLSEEDRHKQGGGFARKRAQLVMEKHPEAGPREVARMAQCGEATVYRARKSK
jgi:hypothetical protein